MRGSILQDRSMLGYSRQLGDKESVTSFGALLLPSLLTLARIQRYCLHSRWYTETKDSVALSYNVGSTDRTSEASTYHGG